MFLMSLNRWLFAGPWIALGSLAAIWLASMLGVFQLPNAWMYWQFHRLTPGERPVPQVLLVEADFVQRQAPEWRELVNQLAQFGPASIGLLHQPAALTESDLERLRESGVVIGQTAAQAAGDNRILTLPPSQALDSLGVHRPQAFSDGQRYISTEAAVARQAQGTAVAETVFLVDFRPGMNYLPVVQAERVLRGDLTQGLVAGRVVLVGRSLDPTNPSLLTPLPEEANVSRLVYAGYAVDTLLRGTPLHALAWWQGVLLSSGVLAVSLLLYFRLGVRHALSIVLSGSALLVVSGWLCLYFLDIVMPVMELVAFLSLLWYMLSRRQRQVEASTIRGLLRASHSRLKVHALPAEFNASEDPWGQIVLLVTQVLSLERVILLERREVGKHVREVRAYRCSIDDIDERRRDIERTPYSTAVAERGPILLQHTFLKAPATECRQLLAPLEFNGQLLGFISAEVSRQILDSNPLFFSILKDFSGYIGELLYHRRAWQMHKHRETRPWRRLLQLNTRASEYASLQEVSQLFDRRLSLLENVFDNLHTATVLYDLFGRVVQINARMEALVSRSDLSIFNMTAADALAALGDMSLQAAREQLQHVMLQGEALTFAAQAPGVETAFILNIQPLKQQRSQGTASQATPFQIQGFLMELTDIAFVARLEQMKDELFNKLSAELRNQLEASTMAAEMLHTEGIEPADREAFTHLIARKLKQMGRTLSHSQNILNEVQGIGQLSDFPVRLSGVAADVVKRWESHLAAHDVILAFEKPSFDALVRVDITQMERALDAFMEVLFDDVSPGGIVRFSLQERQQASGTWSTLFMASEGYGMPDKRLQDILTGTVKTTSPTLHRLHQAADQVTLWGGELHATAAIGEGIRFQIRLPSFSLDD